MAAVQETVDKVKTLDVDAYKYGFFTDIESEKAPKGLNEDIVRFISAKKNEPDWLTDWRLEAFRRWKTMVEPKWARVDYPRIDYQDLYYYSAPKSAAGPKSLEEVDPELLRAYEKLGIPLREQEMLAGVQRDPNERRVAVDAVFNSVSVVTTFKAELAKAGVIFCPISEAVHTHPELVKKYLGSVVPVTDNYFATLNSAVFSDGSFVYVPPGVRCPMELSTYFRINEQNTGQFERTLIIADKGAYVSYLEGCTAPKRDENQLHAAVVELIALDDAEIKYSTVQNWYPGDSEGRGGIFNFVTKRGDCRGDRSKISWTQVETGSAITWKYPSCILRGKLVEGRVLLDRHFKRPSAGRFRHQDAASRRQYVESRHFQGHSRGTVAEHISRPDFGASQGGQRAQFHQLRLAADRQPMRRPYRALYRGEEFHGPVRARGDDVENLRRPAVLRHAARAFGRRGDGPDRQRFCARRLAATADGVRRRGAEAHRPFARRQRRLNPAPPPASRSHCFKVCTMLDIENLHVSVAGKKIIDGLTLKVEAGQVAAIMGPNGSGKSTLSYVIAGRPDYEVTEGSIKLDGVDLLDKAVSERAALGVFLSFQYPLEIPGVATMTFLKAAINAQRKARDEGELTTPEFLKRVREASARLNIAQDMLKRPVNLGFSGGEKKRMEILQMALLEPRFAILDEMDSGLDIDALRICAEGVNALRSGERGLLVITHYQRLLNYISPDVVHVMSKGKIVKSGGPELALELERSGYADYESEAA